MEPRELLRAGVALGASAGTVAGAGASDITHPTLHVQHEGSPNPAASSDRSHLSTHHPTVPQIRDEVFTRHLHNVLTKSGWDITSKERGGDGSRETDWLYVPPGVRPARPFQMGVDHFDSRHQMLQNLKGRHDVASKYVVEFVAKMDEVVKEEAHIVRQLEKKGAMEEIVGRVVERVEEGIILDRVEEGIERNSFEEKEAAGLGMVAEKNPVVAVLREASTTGGDGVTGQTQAPNSPKTEERTLFNDVELCIDVAAAAAATCPGGAGGGGSFDDERPNTPSRPITPGSAVLEISPASSPWNPLSGSVDVTRNTTGDSAETSAPSQRKEPPPPPVQRAPMNDEEKVQEKGTSEDEDKSKVYVLAKKTLPKYVANTSQLIFTPEVIQSKIRIAVLAEVPVSEKHVSETQLLTVSVSDDPQDPHSVILEARGRKDVVFRIKKRVEDIVRNAMISYNRHTLISDGLSLEMDVMLNMKEKIGASVSQTPQDDVVRNKGAGVWIEGTPGDDPQLRRILGRGLDRGAVVLRLDGNNIYSLNDLGRLIGMAKGSGRDSIVLTLCLSKDAELNAVDWSKVLKKGGQAVRRRDGSVYRGKWSAAAATAVEAPKLEPQSSDQRRHAASSSSQSKVKAVSKAGTAEISGTASENASPLGRKESSADSEGNAKRKKYIQFMEKYQPVREIEYKRTGMNAHFVTGVMWEKHKKMYGESCDDNCPCPSRLDQLTESVVPEFLSRELERDKNFPNPHNLKLTESPVGFVSNFVPKFFPKVEREFPNDSPVEVMKKLASMWSKHTAQQRFGIRCRKNCPCLEGWEVIFLNKCLRPKAGTVGMKGKSRPGSTAGVPSAAESASRAHTTIPGRSLSTPAATAASAPSNAKATKAGMGQRREYSVTFDPLAPLGFFCVTEKNADGGGGSVCKITSVGPLAGKKDPRIRVGTVVIATALVKSTVMVNPKAPVSTHADLRKRYEAAKMKRDHTRIRLWFVNTGVVDQPSASHLAASSSSGSVHAPRRDWTSSGAWQGHSPVPGWPGGAAVLQKPAVETGSSQSGDARAKKRVGLASKIADAKRRKMEAANAMSDRTSGTPAASNGVAPAPVHSSRPGGGEALSTRGSLTGGQQLQHRPHGKDPPPVSRAVGKDAPTQDPAHKRAGDASSVSAPAPGQSVGGVSQSATSMPQNAPPPSGSGIVPGNSVLRPSGSFTLAKKSGSRKVRFRDRLVETRTFDAQSARLGGVVSEQDDKKADATPTTPAPAPEATPKAPPPLPSADDLTGAILGGDYKDVMRLLREGADAEQRDSQNRKPYDLVKEMTAKLQHDHNDPSTNRGYVSAQLRDLGLKKTVLKIYINAKFAIDKARYAKKWVNVELTIEKVKNLHLSERGRAHSSSHFLFCEVRIDDQKDEPMPLVPFTDNPNWTRVSNRPKYHFRYNGELDFSFKMGRKIVVSLIKGNSSSANVNAALGTWEESVETIKNHVDPIAFGDKTLEGDLSRTEYLSTGSLVVKVRKSPLEQDFLRRKRSEIARELGMITDWIENFNQEAAAYDSGAPKLTADISMPINGNISLLHAGVYVADLHLVNRLLSLGANPSAKSVVGTAINLAVNLADRKSDSQSTQETHGSLRDILNSLNASARTAAALANNRDDEGGDSRQRDIGEATDRHSGEGENTGSVVQTNPMQHQASQGQPFQFQDPQAVDALATQVQSILKDAALAPVPPSQGQYPIQPQHPPAAHWGQPVPQTATQQVIQNANSGSNAYGANPNVVYHWPAQQSQSFPAVPSYHPPVPIQQAPTLSVPPPYGYTPNPFPASGGTSESDLPLLPSVDWVVGKSQRCPHFAQSEGCIFGANCFNAHVHPPLGSVLDNADGEFSQGKLSRANIHTKGGVDSYGTQLFTSAYLDPKENIIYYAERGANSRRSSQGVYWYPNVEDAVVAVERVVHAAERSEERTDSLGLPVLSSVDWLEGKSVRCTHFNTIGGCRFKAACAKAHVQSPMGSVLDNNSTVPNKLKRKFVYTKERLDSLRNPLFTAAYLKPTENVIYYAERGEGARQSLQGVYWYPSVNAAIDAVEMVVHLAKRGTMAGSGEVTKRSSMTFTPPPGKKIKVDPAAAMRRSSDNVSSNSKWQPPSGKSESEVFKKLMGSNLAAIYQQVFPGEQMKKTFWTTNEQNGLFTVKFRSAARQDNGVVYVPHGNGGTRIGETWWYKDEQSARASTFLQILKQAAVKGIVSEDLTRTTAGKPLSFRK